MTKILKQRVETLEKAVTACIETIEIQYEILQTIITHFRFLPTNDKKFEESI